MADNIHVFGLLEEMLDSGRTPEEVCLNCPELLPEVRERWKQFCLIDAEVGALLPEPGSPPDADVIMSVAPTAGLPQVPGYEVETVLGRGGMGVVYKARHLALKRTVALKMLAGGHADQAERARFRAEAEAVARLQHPHIVQIHEIGETGGLPFFALEFVAGGSLAKRLAGRCLPPRDTAHLVAALAEAMHLAHSRNLVHRDLKPANVLLAGDTDAPISQCQPKVTDFGLVRQLDADSGQTHVGMVMGTPSYMAPEQAEGRAHAAGPAADVYALGAILYECVTGRPPFKGATPLETLEQVRRREPTAPSSLNRQVPRDLETICLKCLRKKPEQRYSSARELADDLGRFLRGEPVTARPVGGAERLGKWVWRRPAAAGLLVALVLLVAAGCVGAWMLARQQAYQVQTDREVRTVLVRARGLLEEGWRVVDLAMLLEARTEADQACGIARSGGASAAVRQQAEAFRQDADLRLDRARKNRVLLAAVLDVSAPQETRVHVRNQAGQLMVQGPPSADQQYAAAFFHWGLDMDATTEDEVVARLGAEPDPVVQELIAALDNWTLKRRQNRPQAEWRRLYRVADRLDHSDRHRRLRALLVGGAPARAESVAGSVGVGSPWLVLWAQARGNVWRQILELQKEIDPGKEPILTVLLLAQAFAAVGDAASAEQLLFQAVTARPDQVVLFDALGKLLERQGPSRLGEAIGYHRAARGLRPHLGLTLSLALLGAGRVEEAEKVLEQVRPQHLANPAFHHYVGLAAEARGRHSQAEAAYREAIALDPNLAAAYTNLGNLLGAQGRAREAEADYRKAIALEPKLALAHFNLAIALLEWRRYSEAEAACRAAIALEPDLADVHLILGNALFRQGKQGEAEAAYRKAIRFDPNSAKAYCNLGSAMSTQGKHHEAEAACRKAIALDPNLTKAYTCLGQALIGQRKYAEAEAACSKAIVLEPSNAAAYNNLSIAQLALRKQTEAEAACRKAIALQPDLAKPYTSLGSVLSARGLHVEAEAACRKAIALQPGLAEAHTNLGIALFWQGKRGAAEAACRKAVALQPRYALAHHNLGSVLLGRQKYVQAEAAYRKAIALEPKLAESYTSLGFALNAQGKVREAEEACRKAIALRPDFGQAYAILGDSLLARQKYGEAEAAYRKAIHFTPKVAWVHHNLGFALMRQAQFKEAVASLKKAGDLLPANHPLRGETRQLTQQCQRYVMLDARLPAILRGTEKPANASEQIEFARLCHLEKRYAAAARFSRDAFTAEPKLAEVVPTDTRYNAACAAALAGCGQGKDANTSDDKERAVWRRQALEWLSQDLAGWGKALDKANAQTRAQVRQTMQHWQTDSDLAGVRAREARARLPDEERKQWEKFWSDVDALLKRASQPE